jgi:hypothetical protein
MNIVIIFSQYRIEMSFGDGKKRKKDRLEDNISGIVRKRRTLEPRTTWAEMQKDHSLVRNCDYFGGGGNINYIKDKI